MAGATLIENGMLCRVLGLSRRRVVTARRRGVSLIEVLVAVFVLTFGLMGIAMVIPAGRHQMIEAAKSDRGSACGRAVINDMQIRGWLDPNGWQQIRRTAPLGAAVNGQVIYGDTYLLDPAFFRASLAAGNPMVQFFPYSRYSSEQKPMRRPWPERALARRVSPLISQAIADRITTWADDLVFSLDGDAQRPRQFFQWDNGEGAAYPVLPGDGAAVTVGTDQPARRTNEGKFSWAAMVTPLVSARYDGTWVDAPPPTPYPMINTSGIARFEVSVVVFYRRNFYCPITSELAPSTGVADINTETVRERSVYARLDGGGIGGGDVLLFIPGDGTNSTDLPTSYLNVRKNQWIMLKGLDRAGAIEVPASSGNWYQPTVCKWYRVVGVDEVFPDGNMPAPEITDPTDSTKTITGRGRYVTLAGPDWNLDTVPSAPEAFDSQLDIAEAAIVDDVVGVYTTVIEVGSL